MSNIPQSHGDEFGMYPESNDILMQYVQTLDPETIASLSKPTSPEVLEIISRSVTAILNNLPFDPQHQLIITERDQLGRILGAVMVDGYFLRNAEQRLQLETLSHL